jgi:hypothetical protein
MLASIENGCNNGALASLLTGGKWGFDSGPHASVSDEAGRAEAPSDPGLGLKGQAHNGFRYDAILAIVG